jgi:tetratricopeptide (TPR) repeat protein
MPNKRSNRIGKKKTSTVNRSRSAKIRTKTTINRSGGAGIAAKKNLHINGDVVGRDKIIQQIMPPPQPPGSSLPNLPYFFGRESELRRIAEALDPKSNGWGVLIIGPGGIGKTTLAIRAGHHAPDDVYSTKIFLSAKKQNLTPEGRLGYKLMLPDYTTLITELALKLGDDGIKLVDPDDRTEVVQRELEKRCVLIIFDNVETFSEDESNQLFQFLRYLPRSCKAIVTSRRSVNAPVDVIRLDRLEKKDAHDLIDNLIDKLKKRSLRRVNITERGKADLYEITNGNPLLIEWVVGQLGRPHGQYRTIAEAYRFLENAPKDNDPLEYIFREVLVSFDDFPEHEQAILALLTHFTLPANDDWIAHITGIKLRAVSTAREDLVARTLLVGEGAEAEAATYFLSPLLAKLLRREKQDIVAKLGVQLVNYTYKLIKNIDREDYLKFDLLDQYWPVIEAALPVLLAGDNDRLQRVCYKLGSFLGTSGRWDERLSLSLQAEKRAKSAGDLLNAGWQAYNAGVVYFRRGQPDSLLKCMKRVDTYWANNEPREKAFAVRLRGWWYRLKKDNLQAAVAFRQALHYLTEISPESLDVVYVLNSLGHVERFAKDYDAAERDYKKALAISKKYKFKLQIPESTGNLAEVAFDRGEWLKAEQLAREALEGTTRLKHQDFMARNYLCLARSLLKQGRKPESLDPARRAVAIFTRLRSPYLEEAQVTLTECGG